MSWWWPTATWKGVITLPLLSTNFTLEFFYVREYLHNLKGVGIELKLHKRQIQIQWWLKPFNVADGRPSYGNISVF